MSIDDKQPSAWTEADLEELCEEHRRETQALEFKQELNLDRDSEKNEVEHDAQGMAAGGGGVIVYGVVEITLADGALAAGSLRALTDGTLASRLENLLDDRGQPRLPFQLHEVTARWRFLPRARNLRAAPSSSGTRHAAMTTRVLLGTSVYLLPLRNPLVAAKQVASLDRIHDLLVCAKADVRELESSRRSSPSRRGFRCIATSGRRARRSPTRPARGRRPGLCA